MNQENPKTKTCPSPPPVAGKIETNRGRSILFFFVVAAPLVALLGIAALGALSVFDPQKFQKLRLGLASQFMDEDAESLIKLKDVIKDKDSKIASMESDLAKAKRDGELLSEKLLRTSAQLKAVSEELEGGRKLSSSKPGEMQENQPSPLMSFTDFSADLERMFSKCQDMSAIGETSADKTDSLKKARSAFREWLNALDGAKIELHGKVSDVVYMKHEKGNTYAILDLPSDKGKRPFPRVRRTSQVGVPITEALRKNLRVGDEITVTGTLEVSSWNDARRNEKIAHRVFVLFNSENSLSHPGLDTKTVLLACQIDKFSEPFNQHLGSDEKMVVFFQMASSMEATVQHRNMPLQPEDDIREVVKPDTERNLTPGQPSSSDAVDIQRQVDPEVAVEESKKPLDPPPAASLVPLPKGWEPIRNAFRSYAKVVAEANADKQLNSELRKKALNEARAKLFKDLNERPLEIHVKVRDVSKSSSSLNIWIARSSMNIDASDYRRIVTVSSKSNLESIPPGSIVVFRAKINKASRHSLSKFNLLFTASDFFGESDEANSWVGAIAVPVSVESVSVLSGDDAKTINDWLESPKLKETLQTAP